MRMQIFGHDIGVCSWSMHTDSVAAWVKIVQKCRLGHVHLAVGSMLEWSATDQAATIQQIRDAGLGITSTMIGFPGESYSSIQSIRTTGGLVPDSEFATRRQILLNAAMLTATAGIPCLSTHIGFLPRSGDEKYRTMLTRVGELGDVLAGMKVQLLMETGQERAAEMLQFLNDLRHTNVAVNFDPANMILYGAGNPVEAVYTLSRHIHHVHLKDATLSDQPGLKWGTETRFGQGDVDAPAFIRALRDVGYTGPLVIEGELGEEPTEVINAAIETLNSITM